MTLKSAFQWSSPKTHQTIREDLNLLPSQALMWSLQDKLVSVVMLGMLSH